MVAATYQPASGAGTSTRGAGVVGTACAGLAGGVALAGALVSAAEQGHKLPASLRKGADLSLYFSFVNRLPRVESDIFDHKLINGDLQQLTLKSGVTLKPGATHEVRLWGVGSNFSKAFGMPNAYLVADGLQARTIAATSSCTES